jgi:hypothetical protein
MSQNLKDILLDLVTHTHSLGFLPLVKISGDEETTLESMAEDRSVVLFAKTHEPVSAFQGTFGLPNLDKLALHLKNPEYKENAQISVETGVRNGATVPVSLHFENEHGDFMNDYRFMNAEIINDRLKSLSFKTPKWDVVFGPSTNSINRLKLQSAAHSEEKVFHVKTENNSLVFFFGDASTHAGSFTFETNVTTSLKHKWAWPVQQTLAILSLSGDKIVRIADAGAMQITVDSGLAQYSYILPAMAK